MNKTWKGYRSVIRHWLQQEPLTVPEIHEITGIGENQIRKFIAKCIFDGNVEHHETRLNRATGKYIKAYRWSGKETIEGLMARAAAHLRDAVGTPESMAMAREIFIFIESRSQELEDEC